MTQQNQARSAILAVFPTPETFIEFSKNSENTSIIQSFIDYAAQNNIIDATNKNTFIDFIRKNTRSQEDCNPLNHLNFEELFEKKDDILELNLSVRAWTDRINALLAEHKIHLPKVSNSMLTRLKKEPADTNHKQNVIRSLAFWIGCERAHLGPHWNFEALLKLCYDSKQSINYREGVRIGFALYGRGDIIGHEIVNWLKKELKNYIEQSIDYFLYGRWGKVKSHDITTLYVDFPKEEKISNPAAYRQCLRSAVTLSHQIAIRWALSKYYTKNRFLSIGIAAGDYAILDNYLLPILNAKLPGDPVIRMTDYTRQCLLINDMRALLCSQPNEITLFNGETLPIWWVVGFWSSTYFDFIPDLLTDKSLQKDQSSLGRRSRLISSAVETGVQPGIESESDAVTALYKFPHNSLLGIEIAKTLYYRRQFWEAIEILYIVLSINPMHLNARTLRMVLFRNLAIISPSYSIADNLFKQSELEAIFIQENCAFQSEDFYCEHAVLFLARAMLTVRYMRNSNGAIPGIKEDMQQLKQKVFSWLDKAESLFGMGIMVSPSGVRSGYLLNSIRILQAILKNDEEIFINPLKPVDAAPEIVKQSSTDLQWQLGYRREDLPQQDQYDFMEKIYETDIITHDDSISLQAYRPTTYFCTAVAWWDFFPLRTVSIAKRVLHILNSSIQIAKSVAKKDVCIYSFTRTYGEMMPAEEFIQHLEKSIQMIKEVAGPNLLNRDDREFIQSDKHISSCLMTLNF